MAICLSHGGPTTFVGDEPASQILVGTVGGVFALDRQSDSKWKIAWKALDGQHVSSVQVEPESGTYFAGVYKGGVHVSDDDGKSWAKRSEGLSSEDVYSLAYANANGATAVYCGTEPARLFRSDDLGGHWSEISALREAPGTEKWTFPAPPFVAHVKFIAVDPTDPDVIYAAVEVGGLMKSRDGGKTWQSQHGFYEDVHRIVICKSDTDKVYISTGAGVYYTVDGGENWKQMTNYAMRIGYPDPMIAVPGRENLMFIAGARNTPGAWRKNHTADSKIARSRDGGRSWELLSNGLPAVMRGNFEAVTIMGWNGSFELYAGTTDGDVYYSGDEGDSWSKIMAGLPPVSKYHHYQGLR
jgi:photosystem II stability/assembly factor-like uncharacterized protein